MGLAMERLFPGSMCGLFSQLVPYLEPRPEFPALMAASDRVAWILCGRAISFGLSQCLLIRSGMGVYSSIRESGWDRAWHVPCCQAFSGRLLPWGGAVMLTGLA